MFVYLRKEIHKETLREKYKKAEKKKKGMRTQVLSARKREKKLGLLQGEPPYPSKRLPSRKKRLNEMTKNGAGESWAVRTIKGCFFVCFFAGVGVLFSLSGCGLCGMCGLFVVVVVASFFSFFPFWWSQRSCARRTASKRKKTKKKKKTIIQTSIWFPSTPTKSELEAFLMVVERHVPVRHRSTRAPQVLPQRRRSAEQHRDTHLLTTGATHG